MNDTIRALSRGLNALRIISETGGTTCQAIADELQLSRPTVYRILGTLVDDGLISVDDAKIYRPTVATRTLENGLTAKAWAHWAALPTLIKLQKEVIWTCEIATFEDYAMVQRDSTHLQNPFRIDVQEFNDQQRSMLTSAVGRTYLAFCPPQEAEQILSHLEQFGDSVDPEAKVGEHTRPMLQAIREKGYAVEQRFSYPHATSIAVPIQFHGRVLACIDIAWISRAVRLSDGIDKFLAALLNAKAEIEERLTSYNFDTLG
ncbi:MULTISPECIES: helix-turn-helix domain-containing protein [unclassified Novosphingobium]|uniref:helix-turn-helix domain-containing protein n=1 Tax=Novosphingobium TaxID=165696 RepID=UPI0014472088|nr:MULTISPECIES: helix-turn-helix domain-containing protein [unclassified Novosphingobium]NKJ44800.1 IclR family mhp operon transcriptional activator [Novosphingobium sp. SG720]NMN05946.1 IclR family mhp operon transcriptional activator [Novosphingobium sp. SG919]NMN88242.1 IclR family mhp operon transcriptional activator [Novosphingobium sp. SG916]